MVPAEASVLYIYIDYFKTLFFLKDKKKKKKKKREREIKINGEEL